jgi:hypothetical protein
MCDARFDEVLGNVCCQQNIFAKLRGSRHAFVKLKKKHDEEKARPA